MPKVYIARCDDYKYENVKKAVSDGIDCLGGIEKLIGGTGKNVAVKPNLLKAHKPEDCVTTHPSVVQAVLESVVASSNNAKVVESPSGPYTKGNLNSIYNATGIKKAAENAGAELNENFEFQDVSTPNGQSVKNLRIIKSIMDADAVVSAAKLKTHAMMTYTGAVKNLFGVVPGISKAECHFRMPSQDDFAGLIVDIADYVGPKLSVIDAVWGMEGDGPSAGDPRKIGCIILSDSPYAADIVGSRIINVPIEENPILKNAVDRGLIVEDEIELLGEDYRDFVIEDFAKPPIFHTSILSGKVPRFLEPIMGKWFLLYPVFSKKICVSCGVCVKSCPNDALKLVDGLPKLDKQKCINCFCCHELCPYKAISIKRPLLLRAASKFTK